ncbi:phosphoserine phosphatase SerB [Canibacter zhoujuaniae]|uniref:phosphoserine phosphatase SerB n=1 Tax=Canibacter zhoujuaniae TaxID=2708343 RepID=UPI0014236848|nr:phosphoserine phosphatase SerB [Canibacter zhoujuaniae]
MNKNAPLVVLDCDSTSIREEVIEIIAKTAGSYEEVKTITDAAMRGEYDFAESLKARVATLKGVPESVFEQTAKQLNFNPGFTELVEAVHARNGHIAVVSGGFLEVLDLVMPAQKVDVWHANRLTVADGKLTGTVSGEIVTAATKADYLKKWAAEFGTPLSHTIAVGDGANDIEMMRIAAISVGYQAKPAVREVADYCFDDTLAHIIPLLDRLG